VCYTDGITEAARAEGEFLDDREFQRLITASQAQPAEPFISTLVDAARRWGGAHFADDVTVVVVDRI
jgi:serine phosphatase RsbU (regulator of sigma subunit)